MPTVARDGRDSSRRLRQRATVRDGCDSSRRLRQGATVRDGCDSSRRLRRVQKAGAGTPAKERTVPATCPERGSIAL